MNSDVSRTDEHNHRGSSWILIYLLQGVWICLGLVFVWLAWNTSPFKVTRYSTL